jgi:hypothetical protein
MYAACAYKIYGPISHRPPHAATPKEIRCKAAPLCTRSVLGVGRASVGRVWSDPRDYGQLPVRAAAGERGALARTPGRRAPVERSGPVRALPGIGAPLRTTTATKPSLRQSLLSATAIS